MYNPPLFGAIQDLLLQVFQNFGRMSFGVGDWNPVFLHRPVRSDQRRGANRPLDRFPLGILSRPPGAVSFHDLDLRVREQGERQVEFGDELIV